ncbi:hypothetical protein AAH446_00125 [Erwinia sp. P6884]|uniref:hypothetical protein n=1 Tax=Erwinia sp. P6884 TaxID=3141450 RepID=UPI003184B030
MTERDIFILDLIEWIEGNMEQRLKIEHVADKSGYSKWYLQRMFRDKTGIRLAEYIRKRKMSKSACALRLTQESILNKQADISPPEVVNIQKRKGSECTIVRCGVDAYQKGDISFLNELAKKLKEGQAYSLDINALRGQSDMNILCCDMLYMKENPPSLPPPGKPVNKHLKFSYSGTAKNFIQFSFFIFSSLCYGGYIHNGKSEILCIEKISSTSINICYYIPVK